MPEKTYFDHTSPEGHDFLYRYRRARYVCNVHVGRTTYMGAENIVLIRLYDSVTAVNGKANYDWNAENKIDEAVVQPRGTGEISFLPISVMRVSASLSPRTNTSI